MLRIHIYVSPNNLLADARKFSLLTEAVHFEHFENAQSLAKRKDIRFSPRTQLFFLLEKYASVFINRPQTKQFVCFLRFMTLRRIELRFQP